MPLVFGNITNKQLVDEVNKSAKLDSENTFTQQNTFNGNVIVQTPTENSHVANKQYVDSKVEEVAGNTIESTTKVKEDLVFTQDSGLYKYEIDIISGHVIMPIRLLKEDDGKLIDVLFHSTEENNKCIIWTSVERIKKLIYLDSLTKQADLGNVARLNTTNTFDEVQTFLKNPVCSVTPTTDNQLANKKYTDDKFNTVTELSNSALQKANEVESALNEFKGQVDIKIDNKLSAKFPIIQSTQRPEDVLTENGQYCFQIVG